MYYYIYSIIMLLIQIVQEGLAIMKSAVICYNRVIMSSPTEKNQEMENIVSLAKRRGFIYPGSDVYGGLSGTWDYGPLGVALKRNIMQLWWKMFVDDRDDMYGVDAAILMNQNVWKASGHVDTFTDPLVEEDRK